MNKVKILIKHDIGKQLTNKYFWVFTCVIPGLIVLVLKLAGNVFEERFNLKGISINSMTEYDLKIIIAFLFWFIINFGLILHVLKLGQSLFEEKKSRLLELLLTSISIKDFLKSRIISTSIISIIQYLLGMGIISFAFLWQWLDTINNNFSISTMDIVWWLMVLFVYFVFGIFLYTCLSMLSVIILKSNENVQLGQILIAIIHLTPTFFIFKIISEPGGSFVSALMYFPLTTALISPMRIILYEFNWLEFFITILVLILTSIILICLANKLLIRSVVLKRNF